MVTLPPIDRRISKGFCMRDWLCFIEKKTFVFDMDETLIHCHTIENKPCDVILIMDFDGSECKVKNFFHCLLISYKG